MLVPSPHANMFSERALLNAYERGTNTDAAEKAYLKTWAATEAAHVPNGEGYIIGDPTKH